MWGFYLSYTLLQYIYIYIYAEFNTYSFFVNNLKIKSDY